MRWSMPQDKNILPSTYNLLTKSFDFFKPKAQKMCAKCCSLLKTGQECKTPACVKFKSLKGNRNKQDPLIIKFYFINDFKEILERNWDI